MKTMNTKQPTSAQVLNAVWHEFVTRIQTILGETFMAAYLQGSFAGGDWDSHSDGDFLLAF